MPIVEKTGELAFGVRMLLGDCRRLLARLPENSIEACLTDAPYGLVEPRSNTNFRSKRSEEVRAARREGLTGEKWDGSVPDVDAWRNIYRVLKPSHYMFVFGSPRTFFQLGTNLEQSGFRVVDVVCHIQSQGYAKGKSQLRPSWDPVLLCRKPGERVMPLPGLDECRIPGSDATGGNGYRSHPMGRWPSNLVIDEEVASQLGNYARYFYCAKSSRLDREEGLWPQEVGNGVESSGRRNIHPT